MTLMLANKKAIVEELSRVANQAVSVVAVNYRGISAQDMVVLRAKARESDVYIKVARNTLVKKALADSDFSCMQQILSGPLLLIFSKEEPSVGARVLSEFNKDYKELEVKGLAIEGKLLDSQDLDAVAKLPTKQEAIAKLMSVMQAPISKLVRTLVAPHIKFIRTLVAVKDKKESDN